MLSTGHPLNSGVLSKVNVDINDRRPAILRSYGLAPCVPVHLNTNPRRSLFIQLSTGNIVRTSVIEELLPVKQSLLIIATSFLLLSACSGQAHPLPDTQSQKEKSMENEVKQMTGTIVYKNLEGGFYAFISDDGGHYTLRNLAPEHKQNGLKIAVEGRVLTNIMTFTQFGEVFEVSDVKIVDKSGVKPTNNEM